MNASSPDPFAFAASPLAGDILPLASKAARREPLITDLLRGSGRCREIYDDAWAATLPVLSSLLREMKRA